MCDAATQSVDSARFIVATWGTDCVVFDAQEGLTHLVPEPAATSLRQALAAPLDSDAFVLASSGLAVPPVDACAAELLRNIGLVQRDRR